MNVYSIASKLFGASRVEESGGISNTVDSVAAVGATDSANGAVGVTMRDADITPADDTETEDQTSFELPTSPAVAENDEIILGLTGDGPLKVPVVIANPGSGDRTDAKAAEALSTAEAVDGKAQQALDVANATGQHFFFDTNGAHVTGITQESWETSPTGPNSLINGLGMLIRNGLNNLLAVLSSGIAIYDGQGNDATNIVASFSGDSVVLGKASDPHIDIRPLPDATTGAQAGLNFYHGGMLGISFSEQGICWYQGYVNGVTLSLYNILDEIRTDRQGMHLYAYSDPVEAIQAARIDLLATEGAISGSGTVKLTGGNLALSNQEGTSTTSMTMEKAIAMLTTASANLTRSSAVSSWSGGQVRRSGKVVTVTIVGAKLASALASNANSAQITTLPAGFIPNLIQRVPCAINGAGNFPNVWAAIGTGGGIQIHNGSPTTIPTDREISLNCTYIIN